MDASDEDGECLQRFELLQPLLTEALTFDRSNYHESIGSPCEDAQAFAAVCKAWRDAVQSVAKREHLFEQMNACIATKEKRLRDTFEYFYVYFGITPLPVRFGCRRPAAEDVERRKKCMEWVNGRFKDIQAHIVTLRSAQESMLLQQGRPLAVSA